MASDLARELELVEDSVSFGNSRFNSLFYADDIVVAASSAAKLQEKVDIINKVGGKFGMKISGSKSKRMVYGNVEVWLGKIVKYIKCISLDNICYKILNFI